jgi:hypothetical protein
MKTTKTLALLFSLCAPLVPCSSQDSPKDISTIYAQGKTEGHVYRNDYFGLTLTVDEAQFTKGSFVNSEGKRARLVDAEASATNWEQRYEIAVLADLLSKNPSIHSAGQYVRAVCHGFENEGWKTIELQFDTEVSGISFSGAALEMSEQGRTWYRGAFTTFLNGYILSLDVTAASTKRLKELVQSKIKFDAPKK